MNAFSLELVRKHFPQLRQPLAPAPWTVLLEQSDTESAGARARRCSKRCSRPRSSAASSTTRRSPSSLEQSHAMWHLRETIPLAQAAGGRATSSTTSRCRSRRSPTSSPRPTRALQRAFPACGWSTSATSATATCTTTCRRPDGDAAPIRRAHRGAHQRARLRRRGSAAAARSRPSTASAQLKRDELARRKSPVALDMMRAIKHALDPANVLNPRAPGRDRCPRRSASPPGAATR